MKIVNLKNKPEPPWIYCGRRMGGKNPVEASPLGNPFKLAGKSPAQIAACLAEYRQWLFAKIKDNDKQIMALMRHIDDDSVLACYCCDKSGQAIFTEPERCHCQVIVKAHRYLKQSGKI